MLIVEVDGGQHAEQADVDRRRDERLQQDGFHTLRFWNHDVLARTEDVLAEIYRMAMQLVHNQEQRLAATPSPPRSSP